MSEEISAGVRILLERIKSNPEEMIEDYGKWGQLRDAVFEYVERGERRAWIRGLRPDEIDLLYEAFSSHARQVFDNYVMKSVLGVDEEKEEYVGQAALNKAMAQRGLLSNFPPPVVNPGSWVSATTTPSSVSATNTTTSTTSLVTRLKQELGIK